MKEAKFQGILPTHNDNVSHDHPLKEFTTLLLGAVGLILLAYWLLGFAVDGAVAHISPETEEQLFAKFDLPLAEKLVDDPEDQARLQHLTDQLRPFVSVAYPVKVLIFKSSMANAFALPGGYMAISTEMLAKVKSENGLAFVIAHELAHFHNRDHLRGMGRGIVMTALAAAVTGPNSSLSRLLAPTSQFGQAQYSQARESLADQTAITALNGYYGHVGGADEFFTQMIGMPEYPVMQPFASHPQLKRRIEKLEQFRIKNGWQVKAVTPY